MITLTLAESGKNIFVLNPENIDCICEAEMAIVGQRSCNEIIVCTLIDFSCGKSLYVKESVTDIFRLMRLRRRKLRRFKKYDV